MRFPWQTALMEAITNPAELIQLLELDSSLLAPARQAARLFPLKVPRRFVALMKKGDSTDPLLLQALPLGAEVQLTDGYVTDPLQETRFNPLPGLLHKYHGRVLLTVTGTCAINCRYCFRRAFPYEENQPGSEGREDILGYIAADPSIKEVILSGGDPLVAGDNLLTTLSQQLAAIPHLKLLRIHTRLPVMLPERITPVLIDWLTGSRLRPVMVLHCNHPREISPDFHQAMHTLRAAGVTLLNQSVLLKGVNDHANILTELSEALFASGILPYYLHVPDKVQGTAHFDLSQPEALRLHQEISARLPGYLVPRLVAEIPGANAKMSIHSPDLYTGQS